MAARGSAADMGYQQDFAERAEVVSVEDAMKHLLVIALALVGILNVNPAPAATVFITGADRGLGLEFTRQYAARGDTVIATCRHPVSYTHLDVYKRQMLRRPPRRDGAAR